ncbi:MAG: hypothetical protein OXB92_00620 [Acidimicrobiaceae bacterium]|nr:hypothetical protein [Acidimicrobiaceae bacterium]
MVVAGNEELLAKIDYITAARALPPSLKKKCDSLRPISYESPALADDYLQEILETYVNGLTLASPPGVLYRASSLQTFQDHCVVPAWDSTAIDHVTFARMVAASANPSSFLHGVMRQDTVFPAIHSWLVSPNTEIEKLSGRKLAEALKIRQEPPFALARISRAHALAFGVEVRVPTAADAVLGNHVRYWNAAGIPAGQEYLDRDVPGAAIEAVLWIR